MKTKHDGKVHYDLHRWIFSNHYKYTFKKGEDIRHLCNNRWCIEIAHLSIGSRKDNIQDAFKAGSFNRKGVHNGNAKITDGTVEKIRRLYKTKEYSQRDLAEKFELAQSHINRILNNESWKS